MIDLKEYIKANPNQKCVNQECMICYGYAGIHRYWARIRKELEQQDQQTPPKERVRKRRTR